MPRGLLYVLVFALPALLVSGIAAFALFGAAAGAMWLFAFGDNPWPQAAQTALGLGFAAAWLALWLGLLALAFVFGRHKGFSGSSMPPRNAGNPTCSCIDTHGREAITVPIAEAMRAVGR